jgi:hypothetical protein
MYTVEAFASLWSPTSSPTVGPGIVRYEDDDGEMQERLANEVTLAPEPD